jgi:hypothetical protein
MDTSKRWVIVRLHLDADHMQRLARTLQRWGVPFEVHVPDVYSAMVEADLMAARRKHEHDAERRDREAHEASAAAQSEHGDET